jgi:Holliday junction resolvase RusA-like endonuclease
VRQRSQRHFEFQIPVKPVAQGSVKAIISRVTRKPMVKYDNEAALKAYRQVVSTIARQARIKQRPMFERREPVEVRVAFFFDAPANPSNPFPSNGDVDKLVRALLDGMTGEVFRDDNQVVRVEATKAYGSPPRVEVVILPV